MCTKIRGTALHWTLFLSRFTDLKKQFSFAGNAESRRKWKWHEHHFSQISLTDKMAELGNLRFIVEGLGLVSNSLNRFLQILSFPAGICWHFRNNRQHIWNSMVFKKTHPEEFSPGFNPSAFYFWHLNFIHALYKNWSRLKEGFKKISHLY